MKYFIDLDVRADEFKANGVPMGARWVLEEQEAHGEAGDATLISEAASLIAKAEGGEK